MASPRIEIVKELRALEQFCTFKTVRSGEEQERFMRDYLADIEEYPLAAIQKACIEWRRSGSTKFPTPGQLIPLIRAKLPAESGGERAEPWSPISEEAYRAMSLRDKIRHQRILAAEAYRKAGPMFRNTSGGGKMHRASGEHLEPSQMPENWHRWMEIGRRHDAEAARLREYIDQPERRAS